MLERSWVRILAPYRMDITFFHINLFLKNCILYLKRPKINAKEAGVGPFLKNKIFSEAEKYSQK